MSRKHSSYEAAQADRDRGYRDAIRDYHNGEPFAATVHGIRPCFRTERDRGYIAGYETGWRTAERNTERRRAVA